MSATNLPQHQAPAGAHNCTARAAQRSAPEAFSDHGYPIKVTAAALPATDRLLNETDEEER